MRTQVAIVGAGPSGLSAAHVLARAGAEVTIFEKEAKGGGLMTYGIAAYALLNALCGGDPQRFREFDVRFTSPVFPGETIRTELWREGAVVLLRANVVERGKVVLDNGRAVIG